MDTHIEYIPIPIEELDSFLLLAFYLYFLKSSKLPYTVVYMGYIVPYCKLVKLL